MDADRQGSHHLQAAGFLFTPRQPAEHEDAHEGHQHHPRGAELERYLTADRVQALRGSVEGDGRRVVLGGGCRLVQGGLSREEALDTDHGKGRQRDDRHDPDEDPDAVATQDETGQGDGSRKRRHGRGRGVASPSRSARSGSCASSSP